MATQTEINDGQQKINGKLCQVDWLLIQALKQIAATLKQQSGGSALTELNGLIELADTLSAEVAHEDPPGCNPPQREIPGVGGGQ